MSGPYFESAMNVVRAEKAGLARQVQALQIRLKTLEALTSRLQSMNSAPCPVCGATIEARHLARSGGSGGSD